MPLNEQSLLFQVNQHARTLQKYQQDQVRDLPLAIEQYRSSTTHTWLSLEELARAKQAAALPVEELDVRRAIDELALPLPAGAYVVVATDGSIIPPDRHGGMAFCQVLNVGEVALGYGERRLAHIEADTRLYFNGVTGSARAGSVNARKVGTASSSGSEDAQAGLQFVDAPLTNDSDDLDYEDANGGGGVE